ncbi:hypothetical protein, partial [Bradyrhizobium valentinum]|uniref:hypothetical protein n=1 Tax=Bradyrhizobium valentinum TaxID=1518501 RepID=UPI000B0B958E
APGPAIALSRNGRISTGRASVRGRIRAEHVPRAFARAAVFAVAARRFAAAASTVVEDSMVAEDDDGNWDRADAIESSGLNEGSDDTEIFEARSVE